MKRNAMFPPACRRRAFGGSVVRLVTKLRHPFDADARRKLRLRFSHRRTGRSPALDFSRIQIPVFIISFNRLSYVRQMVERLERISGDRVRIIIVDNASTYPPLLDYLRNSPHTVYFLDRNYGSRVVWDCGLFDDMLARSVYCVTDPDIALDERLPKDWAEEMCRLLWEYGNVTKVGCALRIDDLPDTLLGTTARKWESRFWTEPVAGERETYVADIDTTFAMYRPGAIPPSQFYAGIRIARGGYMARHLPWYAAGDGTPEDDFYRSTASSQASWLDVGAYTARLEDGE